MLIKNISKAFLYASIITSFQPARALDFDKVIIWGHKLHSHTHSYIHYAYYRAFEHMGYKVYWFNDEDNTSTFDFSKCLFITEGQVDKKIPLNKSSFYILYNCYSDKYNYLIKDNHAITMQVYTHKCIQPGVKQIDKCIFGDLKNKTIYMPWATDLLPHEIEKQKTLVFLPKSKNYIAFVGTISGGKPFDNLDKILAFKKASNKKSIKFYAAGIYSSGTCNEHGILFDQSIGNDAEKHISFIRNAYMAPSLQGWWQCKEGYIPCRIFKNISYGALGITNSRAVWELFDKKIVFNEDPCQLFYDAEEKLKNITIQEIYELMDLVKEKHTYISRIKTLLNFFDQVIAQNRT